MDVRAGRFRVRLPSYSISRSSPIFREMPLSTSRLTMREADFSQEAFVLVGVFLKEKLGDDHAKHGIAQILKTFI